MFELILFDVDGTLITNNRAHLRAFNQLFKILYGIEFHIEKTNHHGLTDYLIIRRILKLKGRSLDEFEAQKQKIRDLLFKLYLEYSSEERVEIIPHVRELIIELEAQGILLGLVTGNLEEIAWHKMQDIGLDSYFKIGGFGSDDESRTRMIEVAIERAQTFTHRTYSKSEILLVGDTPLDVEAAKKAGIKIMAIATGAYSIDSLQKTAADFVIENFKNRSDIIKFILNE